MRHPAKSFLKVADKFSRCQAEEAASIASHGTMWPRLHFLNLTFYDPILAFSRSF